MSVLGVVGAAAGFVIGGPQGAMLGYSLGSGVDAMINAPDIEGPRLDDLKVQMSSYGAPIPFEYGTNRHAGTIIWPKEIILNEKSESESAKGGPEQTTYTYSCSMAVLICEGPIAGVRRIWANKKIIYDVTGSAATNKDPTISGLRFYLGTETQAPDPLIEAKDGPSPAYLGYAYCVFEDLELTDFANRPPMLEFEVLTVGNDELPQPVAMGPAGRSAAVDPNTGYIWSVSPSNDSFAVHITDNATKSLVKTIDVLRPGSDTGNGLSICYVDSTDEFWVGSSGDQADAFLFSASAQEYIRFVNFRAFEYACRESQAASFGPALTWGGKLQYDKVYDKVLIGTTNLNCILRGYDPHTLASAPDPCGFSEFYPVNLSPHYALTLPPNTLDGIGSITTSPTGLTLVTTEGHVFVMRNGVILRDIVINTVNFRIERVSYDTKRDTLLLISVDSSELVTINAVTEQVIITPYALPANAPTQATNIFSHVLYHAQTDRYYITAMNIGAKFTLFTILPGSLEIESVRVYDGVKSSTSVLEIADAPGYFVNLDEATGQAWRIPLGTALQPSPVNLGAIVANICARAGLPSAEINVTQLTDLVDGYLVPRQMSGRAAIEPLQTAFYFDAVESDAALKFVKRGAGAPITISMEDRAARAFGADLPDSLAVVRAQDMELPVQVDVEFADINADHLVGNQYARRLTKDTKQRINLQSPVVMNATKAKQVADVTLYRAWLNQSYKFTTTRKWAHLEPTDIVVLPTLEANYSARIVSKREQPSGVIEWEAAMEGVEVYTQSGVGAVPTNYVQQTIYAPGSTLLHLLDIPILRDQDNNAGFYDAMAGTSGTWTGAQLFRSADGGATYDPVHITSDAAKIGAAQSVLPNFTAGNIIDEGSSVTVVMKSGSALTSVTDTQLFNGANLAIIGKPGRWEVIQFRGATLIAANTYQLSGLLRGRRGTEWATGTHQVGDVFILAGLTGWNRVVLGADVGLQRQYKAPAFRMPLSSAPAETFTNTGIGLKPFAPVNLVGDRDASNNLTLKWNRRSRLASGPLHAPVPLGEASESYSIDIMIGATVKRTLTSSTPSVIYSAANQTADGIALGAAVTARVHQISQVVGRGYPLEGTV